MGNDDDMHVSQEIKILIPEQELLKIDDDSPEMSGVYSPDGQGNPSPQQQTIKAPIGDPIFWLYIHVGMVDYAIRKFDQDKRLAEVRGELLEANVAREYAARKEAEKELKKLKDLIALRESALTETVIALFRTEDKNETLELRLKNTENALAAVSEDYFPALVRALAAENKAEQKEILLQMYEKRFGSREKLLKLAEAEQKCEDQQRKCMRENYGCIDKITQYHDLGRCPKTVGQRISHFLERITSPATYYKIARAIRYAFTKKEEK
jgi:hypothetical protein